MQTGKVRLDQLGATGIITRLVGEQNQPHPVPPGCAVLQTELPHAIKKMADHIDANDIALDPFCCVGYRS
jgi:hypothetical protein